MSAATWNSVDTLESRPSSEVKLLLQSLIFEYNDNPKQLVSNEVIRRGLCKLQLCCGYDDPHLQIKWCQLAVIALNNSQCAFNRRELNELIQFILDACKRTNYIYSTVEALGALLYNAQLEDVDYMDEIVGDQGVLLELCQGLAPEKEVQHLAFRCLNNLLGRLKDDNYLEVIMSMLSRVSHSRNPGDNINKTRVSLGLARCFATAAKSNKSPHGTELILSFVKGSMFEGIGRFTSPAISLESLSLDELNLSDTSNRQSQPHVRMKKSRQKKKKPVIGNDNEEFRRRQPNKLYPIPNTKVSQKPFGQNGATAITSSKNDPHEETASKNEPVQIQKNMGFETKQTDFSVSTSESEYSESDTEDGIQGKVAVIQTRVRFSSFVALQQCIGNIRKTNMYSVWCAFLPPDPSTGLLNIIRKETNTKCKIAALGSLSALIDASKHYFVAANSHQGQSPGKANVSFTPFSQTLAEALISLHDELLDLYPGCHAGVAPHLLQCLAVLVVNTPYSKLRPGIITRVLDLCYDTLAGIAADATQNKMQIASLNLLCACFTVETPSSEVAGWLQCKNDTLQHILEALQFPNNHKDGLQVICRLIRFYFPSIITWWKDIREKSQAILSASSDTLIQNMSLLVLEELGKVLINSLEKEVLELEVIKEHWTDILKVIIVPILQDELSPLAPGACDILSTIGNPVFTALETHTQRLIMTLVLALTHHKSIAVVSSACRCLGVFVTYPCIHDDLLFVADTANAIIKSLEEPSTADSSLVLRVSWSLGNLSDTLVTNKLQNPMFVNDFSDLLLGRLFEVCLKWVGGNDKIKSNIVRALGNLLKFIKKSTYEKVHFVDYVSSSITCLLQCSSSGMMKTRWNACYALVNTLQNPVLNPSQSQWGPELFQTLIDVIAQCKNFKVRINATLALSQCVSRDHYGNYFCKIWSTVFGILVDGIGSPPPNMVGYSEKLRLQLVLLICHLVSLHEIDDRSEMVGAFPSKGYQSDLIRSSSRVSTLDTLTPEEQDIIEKGRQTALQVKPDLDLLYVMLSPTELPSDDEAFRTSDISSQKH